MFGDESLVQKGASFTTIGALDGDGNKCVRLSDLQVTGYEKGVDAPWGEISITPLENDGRNKKCPGDSTVNLAYVWIDDEGSDMPAGWYGPDDCPMSDDQSIAGNADEITFAPGDGILVTVSSGYQSWRLQSAGEVIQKGFAKKFGDESLVLIANPLARSICLTELTVGGYEKGVDAPWGEINITPLENDGRNKKCPGDPTVNLAYVWIDDEGSDMPAGWYGPDDCPMVDDQSIAGNAEDVNFAVGESVYFTVSSGYQDWTIEFPDL